MKQLWAPWRMEYILSGDELGDACVFCALPAQGPARHRDNLILCADERVFVILNRFPYSNGHLLVVPRRHVADPNDLDADDYRALCDAQRLASRTLRETFSAHGINWGMNLGRVAGAGIDQHCHFHIVPRWNGDTNFMPIVGETKVMSEHLVATWDRLRPRFAGLLGGNP
jgi:ATP adenylyltransferase